MHNWTVRMDREKEYAMSAQVLEVSLLGAVAAVVAAVVVVVVVVAAAI